MTNRPVKIFLYSGGKIIEGTQGCGYSLPPQLLLRVDRKICLSELLSTIYSKINIDRSIFKIRLICRYPRDKAATSFLRVRIDNDEDLRDALEIPKSHGLSGVEVYVECDDLGSEPSPINSIGEQHGSEEIERGGHYEGHWRNEVQDQPRMLSEAGHSSSHGINMLFQPSMVGCSMDMEQRGLPGSVERHNEEGIEDTEEEESEGFENECVYGSDESESEGSDYVAQVGDPDDDVPFYSDIGNKKYHKYDTWDVDSEDDKPGSIWVDENSGLKQGMIFPSKELFQYAVRRVCAKEMKSFKVCMSNPTTWKVQCTNLSAFGCSWMVSGAKKGHGCFEITKVNSKHSCRTTVSSGGHSNFGSKSIARIIRKNVADNPAYKPCDVVADMSNIGVDVSYKKAWLAKKRAKEDVYGNWETSYSILPRYFRAIQAVNQGLVVRWKFPPDSLPDVKVFDAVFWAFPQSIEAFQHCRPVITIDGTHQYGRYKETIFIACGVDAAGHVVPLAFAITGGENLPNWFWFLQNLMEYVVRGRQGVCIISDRHPGIMSSFRKMTRLHPPSVHHRYCLRHFLQNFSTTIKNAELTELVDRAARTPQIRKFNSMMESINRINGAAFQWLMKAPLEKWTLCYDGGVRYGIMTTNRSESFNGVLKGSRDLPITAFVRASFKKLNKYFVEYGSEGVEHLKVGDPWPQDVMTRFLSIQHKSRYHGCTSYNPAEGVFEVVTRSSNVHTVSLREKTCSCGKFQIYRIPCSHAYRACAVPHRNAPVFDARDLVDECYGSSKLVDTYAYKFTPVPHPDYWPSDPFKLVPDFSRKNVNAGRLCNTRIPNEQDHPRMLRGRCKSCKSRTHTTKTCPRRAALRCGTSHSVHP